MRDQRHAPAALYPWEGPGTHCAGGWVGPRAGLNRCGKSRPPTGIRSPDRSARSQSLYRLRYPAHYCFPKIDSNYVPRLSAAPPSPVPTEVLVAFLFSRNIWGNHSGCLFMVYFSGMWRCVFGQGSVKKSQIICLTLNMKKIIYSEASELEWLKNTAVDVLSEISNSKFFKYLRSSGMLPSVDW